MSTRFGTDREEGQRLPGFDPDSLPVPPGWDGSGKPVGSVPVDKGSSAYPEEGGIWKEYLSLVAEMTETVLLAIVIFLLIRMALQTFRIDGSSMEPNFYDGQFLMVDKLSIRILPLRRGDVVVFHYPGDPRKDYIKRVIGLPGEQVAVELGHVYVGDARLNEPYDIYPASYSWGPALVASNKVFVLGDNREHSSDSHSWGMLARDQIVGRAWLSYWPPEVWGPVTRYSDAVAHPEP